jgi:hypothetical protein
LTARRFDLQAQLRTARGKRAKQAIRRELRQTKRALRGMPSLDELNRRLTDVIAAGPQYDITQEPPTEEEQINQQYQDELARQSLAALRGETDFDPFLTQQLAQEEEALREALTRNLGPQYEASSPGIEALARFREQRGRVLGGARLNQMLALREAGLRGRSESLRQTRMLQDLFANPPLTEAIFGGSLAELANAIRAAEDPYFRERQAEFGASLLPTKGEYRGQQLQQGGQLWASSFSGGSFGSPTPEREQEPQQEQTQTPSRG